MQHVGARINVGIVQDSCFRNPVLEALSHTEYLVNFHYVLGYYIMA